MCIFYLFKYWEIWMRKKYERVWFLYQHIVCLYYSYFVVYNYSSWHHLFKVCSFVKRFIPRENVAIPLFVDECYLVLFGLQTRLSDRSCYSVFDWMNVIVSLILIEWHIISSLIGCFTCDKCCDIIYNSSII